MGKVELENRLAHIQLAILAVGSVLFFIPFLWHAIGGVLSVSFLAGVQGWLVTELVRTVLLLRPAKRSKWPATNRDLEEN